MATKDSRIQRAKKKAKEARVQRQKEAEQRNYQEIVRIVEPTLSMFRSLPEPDENFDYTIPIIDFIKQEYPAETDEATIVDGTLMQISLYMNWGLYGEEIPMSEVQFMFDILCVNTTLIERIKKELSHKD